MSTRNTTLSALIRQGFETATTADAELPGHREDPILAGLAVRKVPDLMHDPAVPLGRQDEVMAALIRCYRRSPHSGWSAVLLETLSPMVVAVGGTFAFVPDGISREDVDHQLIAEALYVARAFALPQSPRYMQRWLQRRLLRRMARWLAGCARGRGESLEQVDQSGIGHQDAGQLFLMELADSGVRHEDLVLLYRAHVLGMTARELAIELGVTAATVTNRQRRALRRLRSWAPANFHRSSGGIPTAA